MKFTRLLLLVLFLFGFPVSAEYQQQGFDQFQAFDGNMEFVCTNQCIALIGPRQGSDYLQLQGSVQGQGVVGYGFLVGQQVIPGEMLQINGPVVLNQQFDFSAFPYISQIPADAQIVFLLQGQLSGSQVRLDPGFLTLGQKFVKGWKEFWKMETLTPYSINLRYGVKILGTSIVAYGYILFIIAALYILLFSTGNKKKKFRSIFFRGIGIFLFIGIRNFITDVWIVHQGLKTYTNQLYEYKTFFDLGDYITFTDKIRKALNLDAENKTCKIFVDSFQDWPFKSHWEFVYLKPCIITLTGSEADYIIYYKKPVATGDFQKQVLVDFNGSYLLQNK